MAFFPFPSYPSADTDDILDKHTWVVIYITKIVLFSCFSYLLFKTPSYEKMLLRTIRVSQNSSTTFYPEKVRK